MRFRYTDGRINTRGHDCQKQPCPSGVKWRVGFHCFFLRLFFRETNGRSHKIILIDRVCPRELGQHVRDLRTRKLIFVSCWCDVPSRNIEKLIYNPRWRQFSSYRRPHYAEVSATLPCKSRSVIDQRNTRRLSVRMRRNTGKDNILRKI